MKENPMHDHNLVEGSTIEDDAIPFVPETPNNRRPQGQPTFPF